MSQTHSRLKNIRAFFLFGMVLFLCFCVDTVRAVTFTSNVTVTGGASIIGSLSKGGGSFVIDNPLDPKNKLLYHSFVESPDAKNIYDGIATLDAQGEATIELPDYFEALNEEYRYLVTPLAQAMPNLHVAGEVRNDAWWHGGHRIVFTVSGGMPHGKISWQVTGIRHDPFIEANPIIPEVEKGPGQLVNQGEYVCTECYEK